MYRYFRTGHSKKLDLFTRNLSTLSITSNQRIEMHKVPKIDVSTKIPYHSALKAAIYSGAKYASKTVIYHHEVKMIFFKVNKFFQFSKIYLLVCFCVIKLKMYRLCRKISIDRQFILVNYN